LLGIESGRRYKSGCFMSGSVVKKELVWVLIFLLSFCFIVVAAVLTYLAVEVYNVGSESNMFILHLTSSFGFVETIVAVTIFKVAIVSTALLLAVKSGSNSPLRRVVGEGILLGYLITSFVDFLNDLLAIFYTPLGEYAPAAIAVSIITLFVVAPYVYIRYRVLTRGH